MIFIIIFLHGLGRLTCSGIDALPSFPGASSSRFVVEGVFRESGVVHSFKAVDPVLFVCLCLYLILNWILIRCFKNFVYYFAIKLSYWKWNCLTFYFFWGGGDVFSCQYTTLCDVMLISVIFHAEEITRVSFKNWTMSKKIITMTLNANRTETVTDVFTYISIIYTPQCDVRGTKKGHVLCDASGNFLWDSVLRHRLHVRSWKFPRHTKFQTQRGYIFQFHRSRKYVSHVGIDWQVRCI